MLSRIISIIVYINLIFLTSCSNDTATDTFADTDGDTDTHGAITDGDKADGDEDEEAVIEDDGDVIDGDEAEDGDGDLQEDGDVIDGDDEDELDPNACDEAYARRCVNNVVEICRDGRWEMYQDCLIYTPEHICIDGQCELVDTDGDADVEPEIERDLADPDMEWRNYFDRDSGLIWDLQTHDYEGTWEEAVDYCERMGTDFIDWRLPSIDELRTLIRGCDRLRYDCGYSDECTLHPECGGVDECISACGHGDGPGEGGCYLPEEIGRCNQFWTSIPYNEEESFTVGFFVASISPEPITRDFGVLCVTGEMF